MQYITSTTTTTTQLTVSSTSNTSTSTIQIILRISCNLRGPSTDRSAHPVMWLFITPSWSQSLGGQGQARCMLTWNCQAPCKVAMMATATTAMWAMTLMQAHPVLLVTWLVMLLVLQAVLLLGLQAVLLLVLQVVLQVALAGACTRSCPLPPSCSLAVQMAVQCWAMQYKTVQP